MSQADIRKSALKKPFYFCINDFYNLNEKIYEIHPNLLVDVNNLSAHERITYRITIDASKCNGCNNCTTVCPVNAELKIQEDYDPDDRVIAIRNGVAIVINPFRCDGDGVCMLVCPEDCITIEFIPLTEYVDNKINKKVQAEE